MAAFGMDGLPILKCHQQVQIPQEYRLPSLALKVHLYGPDVVIPQHLMTESVQVEIGMQLPIQPYQDIPVEGGRYSPAVIIGGLQNGPRFH